MFGYILADPQHMTDEEYLRYRGAYCGLCHALGERHGWLARFTLQYDFTFLAILLAAGEQGDRPSCRRCPAHPWRKPRACLAGKRLYDAADESIILFYHKLSDDVSDHGLITGLPYRAGSMSIGSYVNPYWTKPGYSQTLEYTVGFSPKEEYAPADPFFEVTAQCTLLTVEG